MQQNKTLEIHSLIHEAAFALENGNIDEVKRLHLKIDLMTHETKDHPASTEQTEPLAKFSFSLTGASSTTGWKPVERTSLNDRFSRDFYLKVSITSDLLPENEQTVRATISSAIEKAVYQELGRWRNTGVVVEEVEEFHWIDADNQAPEAHQDVLFKIDNEGKYDHGKILVGKYHCRLQYIHEFTTPGCAWPAKYWCPMPTSLTK